MVVLEGSGRGVGGRSAIGAVYYHAAGAITHPPGVPPASVFLKVTSIAAHVRWRKDKDACVRVGVANDRSRAVYAMLMQRKS